MASSIPPPPPILFSPGQPYPPPSKKQRAGGTPGKDNILHESDDAINRRRAEIDRLQQKQRQFGPTMEMVRDQLNRPSSLPGSGVPTPQRRAPSPKRGPLSPQRGPPTAPGVPKTSSAYPPVKTAMSNGGTVQIEPPRQTTRDSTTLPPPAPAHVVNVQRRLDDSFVSSPKSDLSQHKTKSHRQPSPIKGSPGNSRTLLTKNAAVAPPELPTNLSRSVRTPETPSRKTLTPFVSPGKSLSLPSPPVGASRVVSQELEPPSNEPGPFGGPSTFTKTNGKSDVVNNRFRSEPNVSKDSPKSKPQVSFQTTVVHFSPPNETNFDNNNDDTTTTIPKTPLPSGKSALMTPSNDVPVSRFAGHTPFHGTGNTTVAETPTNDDLNEGPQIPSTARSELLSTMRSYAESPSSNRGYDADPTTNYISSEIATPHSRLPPNLTSGTKDKKHVGFLSPMTSISTPSMRSPQSICKRAPTPHPKLSQAITTQQQHLVEAAEVVTFEYESDAAVFTVRRPFGLAAEHELWFSAGLLNAKMYAKNANVTRPSSLEVVATIQFDGSILALSGDLEVRHRQAHEYKWKEFGNVRQNDIFLGNVTYIDGDANEREYSLDSICEGALSVREHYCSSILSTGEAFRLRQNSLPNLTSSSTEVGPIEASPSIEKLPSIDANVGTEDMPYINNMDRMTEGESAKPIPPPVVEEQYTETSSDVLSTAVGFFFSTIFSIVWFIVVRVPFTIVLHMFTIAVATVLLSILRLYFADDNGAAVLGASIHPTINPPGIL